jgi:hypothetical protein
MFEMIWIKLGILLTGFLYAGLLPYTIRKGIRHVDIDLEKFTLSFLSNKELYGKRYRRAYKRLLFAMALINYGFFWLLSVFYDLGEFTGYMRYMDYSFASLALLAFVPHNIHPLSFRHFGQSLLRVIHNLLAVLVFLTIPTLIIAFQAAILADQPILGISGMVIVGMVILLTLASIIARGLNGLAEIVFINGIGLWGIFVTIMTFIH